MDDKWLERCLYVLCNQLFCNIRQSVVEHFTGKNHTISKRCHTMKVKKNFMIDLNFGM